MDNLQTRIPDEKNATTMGILSIVLAFCCAPFNIIFGIIGIVKVNAGMADYIANPDAYLPSSYAKLKSAKTLAIIGIIIGILFTLYSILFPLFRSIQRDDGNV